jgi:hypothetical protein
MLLFLLFVLSVLLTLALMLSEQEFTCRIAVEGVPVVPVPLFDVLDPLDAEDYDSRVLSLSLSSVCTFVWLVDCGAVYVSSLRQHRLNLRSRVDRRWRRWLLSPLLLG